MSWDENPVGGAALAKMGHEGKTWTSVSQPLLGGSIRDRQYGWWVMDTDSMVRPLGVQSQLYYSQLGDLGQDTTPLWASLLSPVKQGEYLYLPHMVAMALK